MDIIGPITKYLKKTQGKVGHRRVCRNLQDIDRSVLLSLEKVQKQRDLVMTIQDSRTIRYVTWNTHDTR